MPAFRLAELAERLGLSYTGKGELLLTGPAGLEQATGEQLSFLASARYLEQASITAAGAVLTNQELATRLPASCAVLISADPYLAFARALELFHPAPQDARAGQHPTAVVDPEARVDASAWIGPHCIVEAEAEIGPRTRLVGNCIVYRGVKIGADCLLHGGCQVREACQIGDRVVLQNGAVIGAEGFGFAPDGKGGYRKIPQAGIVILEEDVEVGANSCIDRATMEATVVAAGSKLDNLVQLGHNVRIGRGTVIAAQTGVAGSTSIGNGVQLGGHVAVNGHIQLGDGVRVGGNSGVVSSQPAGAIVAGFPAIGHREFLRVSAAVPRLPELLRRLRRVERQLEQQPQNEESGR